jgi:hypothetical protein
VLAYSDPVASPEFWFETGPEATPIWEPVCVTIMSARPHASPCSEKAISGTGLRLSSLQLRTGGFGSVAFLVAVKF